MDHWRKYPLAAQAVMNEPAFLAQIPRELVDNQSTYSLDIDHYTKVLGME